MNVLSVFFFVFAVIGALDYIIENKFKIGEEFKKGFMLFGSMALSMIGMLVLAPAFGELMRPALGVLKDVLGIDPSIIPASLFANDMGGMSIAQSICKTESMGGFNAFVVSSMMGCVISFTIPFSIGIVKKEQHKELFFGLLCGIVTVPVGCFVAGLMCGLSVFALFLDLLPLVLLSALLGALLLLVPNKCMKCFAVFGAFMRVVGVVGLLLAIFTFLTKVQISPYFDSLENAAFVCVNAAVTLSGMLPLMAIVARLLDKPLRALGAKLGINSVATLSLFASLVTNASSFGVMEKMDKKGVVINAAFAVSASFVFGSHLAFTMAFDGSYLLPMIVGKLISGIAAALLAFAIYRDRAKDPA